MQTYIVKVEIQAEVEAFNVEDAREYVTDIFSVDDEIKSVKIINIK